MAGRLLLEFALSGTTLLVALTAPGLLLLRGVRFASDSRADRFLATLSCSIAYWAMLGLVLGYLGLYVKAAVLAALLVPLVAVLVWRRGSRPLTTPATEPGASGLADRAVLGLVLLYLGLALVDALTSPYTHWDAVVSWDKWAVDWARRSRVTDYLFGSYGQVLPIVSSISYKLAGSFNELLPVQTYVNHGAQVLFALAFVVAIVRLTRLWRLPLWPALVALFGLATFRDYTTSGHTDMLLLFLDAAALALTLGYLEGRWRVEKPVAWVLAPIFAVIVLTKLSGVLWLGLLFLVSLQFRLERPEQFRRVVPHPLLTGALIACLTAAGGLLYYGPQYYLDKTFDVSKADPFEQVFTFASVWGALAVDSAAASQGHPILTQLQAMGAAVFDGYGLRPVFTSALEVAFLAALVSSLTDRRFWVIVPFAIAYGAVFMRVASYDLRNALPMLALCALALSGGVAVWERILASRRWLRPVIAMPMLALLLGALALVYGVAEKVVGLTSGPLNVAARLSALAQPAGARVRLFFPYYAADLDFLEATAVYARASHVVLASELYRFVRHGLYPMKATDTGILAPGDIFGAPHGDLPPFRDDWTRVKPAMHEFWILDRARVPVDRAPILLTGSEPPTRLRQVGDALDVEFTGGDSLVAMQVSELGAMSRGGSIVWRVALQKLNERGPIRAFYLTHFDSRLNAKVSQPGTVVMAEPTLAADGQSLRYSGLLTLEPLHLPLGPTDAVIVGIACDTPGQRVRITQFVMSQYPRP